LASAFAAGRGRRIGGGRVVVCVSLGRAERLRFGAVQDWVGLVV
jgi:hypothetical protein